MSKQYDILAVNPMHGSAESATKLGVALSCIGARFKTWQTMMNFPDCDANRKYELNVGKVGIPEDGCWKNYDSSPPTSYRDIVDYVKEYHSTPERFEVGISRSNKDIWGTDQKMIATRMRQYVIRYGSSRLKMQYETRSFRRLDRGETTWYNTIDRMGIDMLKDSHFLQTTYSLGQWWQAMHARVRIKFK